jgi:hypothetical protein
MTSAEKHHDEKPHWHLPTIRSRLVLVIAVVLVVAPLTAVLSIEWVTPRFKPELRLIDYAGVKVLGSEEYVGERDHRIIRMTVQFDKPVVSAEDAQDYLAALVKGTKDRFDYYFVQILNRKGQQVLTAWADNTGRSRVAQEPAYVEQP